MCMIDDADDCTLLSRITRKANKDHRCDECRRVVEKGEKYVIDNIVFQNKAITYKTCLHCTVAKRWLLQECRGWAYQGVEEDIHEHATSGYYKMDLLRLAIGMQWRWRTAKGLLMPIPKMPKTTHELKAA